MSITQKGENAKLNLISPFRGKGGKERYRIFVLLTKK